MPRVSIIMNCLNCADDLPQALASLKAQTFQDFEIIFWDNGSTDASGDIARAYGPDLRYFRGTGTVPLGEARNLAIAQAKGEYIAFLDCDDLWAPAKLEKQVDLLDRDPGVGLVCTDTEIVDGKRVISRVFADAQPARGMVFDQLLTRQWISMSSAVIRAKALYELDSGGKWFDENLEVCEEADVFYRIAHDWRLDYVNLPLTVWRVHGGNTTFRKFGKFADETLAILAKHRRLYADYDEKHAETVALLTRRAAFQKAVALWREGQNSLAREHIRPYLRAGIKYKAFWWASFLPGAAFDIMARLYFAIPGIFRR